MGRAKGYFNRINFRDIKFCDFRKIKSRENAFDRSFAKLNSPWFLSRLFFAHFSLLFMKKIIDDDEEKS